jgi:hypothetical protein
MSSPGSVILRIELPRLTVADQLAAAVWLALGIAVMRLATPGSPGTALALGAALASMGFVSTVLGAFLHGVASIGLTGTGTLLIEYRDGFAATATAGGRSRLLGSSMFLAWQPRARLRGHRTSLWLTPLDVPAASLRRLAVALRCTIGRRDL